MVAILDGTGETWEKLGLTFFLTCYIALNAPHSVMTITTLCR